MPTPVPKSTKTVYSEFAYVAIIWLISRLLVVIAMQIVAPLMPFTPVDGWSALGPFQNFSPTPGWEVFTHWDGAWYQKIVMQGYDYANDDQQHTIAFFPVYPLLSYVISSLGLPFSVAGTLVSNFAFLGALWFLFLWAKERCDVKTASWATAVLAFCPWSLFCSVTYTEAVFLLCTTAALRSFDQRHYIWAVFWGGLATATRFLGIALVPTFLFVAWKEKRPMVAYVAAILTGIGLVLFSLYCVLKFGDPLAFWRVQKSWGDSGWITLITKMIEKKSPSVDTSLRLIMIFGSIYLLWRSRLALSRSALFYGYSSLALILASGATLSVNRFVYAIVSTSLALGMLLARHPLWGYTVLAIFGVALSIFSVRFTWWQWVA